MQQIWKEGIKSLSVYWLNFFYIVNGFIFFTPCYCILLEFPSLFSLSLCVWTFFHVTIRCVCAYFSFYFETINSCDPYFLAGPNFEKWISNFSINLFRFLESDEITAEIQISTVIIMMTLRIGQRGHSQLDLELGRTFWSPFIIESFT